MHEHSLPPAAPFSILAFFAGCAAMAIVETADTSIAQSTPSRSFSWALGLKVRQKNARDKGLRAGLPCHPLGLAATVLDSWHSRLPDHTEVHGF